MPFKSQAQRRKFAQLLVEGKISDQTFEEWNRETGGKKLNFTYVAAVKGKLKAKTARELQAEIGAMGDGFWKQAFSIGGMPVKLSELVPGAYSICAVPYPVEVTGMAATLDYGEREGDNLPIYCKQLAVGASPPEQKSTLEVTAPPFVPPPADGT